MCSVTYNKPCRTTHIGTYWHLHPGMLATACERCPAGWLVTKTISVLTLRQRDKQDVREMNSRRAELNSTNGQKHQLACSFLAPGLQIMKGHETYEYMCKSL